MSDQPYGEAEISAAKQQIAALLAAGYTWPEAMNLAARQLAEAQKKPVIYRALAKITDLIFFGFWGKSDG